MFYMKNAISFASDIDTFLDPPALQDCIDFIHTRVLLIFLPRLDSCLKMAIFFLYKKSNNNNKIPFQIKFKYAICCGDGSALPGIEHRKVKELIVSIN